MSSASFRVLQMFAESRSSGLERKVGGKFHLKLNMSSRPIANKYHEGKMKRTLKRELKVPELAERKADGTSVAWKDCCVQQGLLVMPAQAVFRVLICVCAMVLALFVINSVGVKMTLRTW